MERKPSESAAIRPRSHVLAVRVLIAKAERDRCQQSQWSTDANNPSDTDHAKRAYFLFRGGSIAFSRRVTNALPRILTDDAARHHRGRNGGGPYDIVGRVVCIRSIKPVASFSSLQWRAVGTLCDRLQGGCVASRRILLPVSHALLDGGGTAAIPPLLYDSVRRCSTGGDQN